VHYALSLCGLPCTVVVIAGGISGLFCSEEEEEMREKIE
jgi:hypothetical protein